MRILKLFIISILALTSCDGLLKNGASDELKIAVLADLHISPGNAQVENLAQAVDFINKSDFDFVIVAGDITNVGSNAELEAVKSGLDSLQKPYFFVPGNHETNWSESACQKIIDIFGNDRFVYEVGDYIFIGYSTGPYIKMGDGAVKKEDIIWLEDELSKRYKEGKKVVSVAHYPLGDGLGNYRDVVDVLSKYNTILHINGHHHIYDLKNYTGIPGFMAPAMVAKPDSNGIFSSVSISADSVKLFRLQEINNYQPDEKYFAYSLNDDLSKVGTPFPGVYHEPMFDDKIVPFSYQESASIYTGVCFPTENSIAYGTSEGQVKCLDISSKKIIWESPKSSTIFSTPFAYQGLVVLGRINGDVEAYNAENGEKVWAFNIGSPIVQEGVVDADGFGYIGGSFGEFVKFDVKSGKVIWNKKVGNGLFQGKPTIHKDKILLGCWDRFLYCVDKIDGSTVWKWTNGSSQKLYSPGNVVPAVSNGKVFIVAPDRHMTAINLANGKQIWRTNLHKVRESLCLSKKGDKVYAKTMNDVLICVSTKAKDFKLLWQADVKYGYEHSPVPPLEANNNLVFLSNRQGQVFAVDANNASVKWKFDAGNSAANKIVMKPDGSVWITLIEGRILSIEPMEIF